MLRARAETKWFWFTLWIVLALAYVTTGRMCIAVSALVANVSWVLFIPTGLSLTASLLWGWRVAPGVFVGELLIGLTTHQPLSTSLIAALGNGADAALAGWWFRDRLGRRIEFDHLRDIVQLLVAELLILQPFSTAMGMLALTVGGTLPAGQLWSTASAWYAANVFAQFVIAPAVLVWLRWSRPATTRTASLELAGLVTLTLLVGAVGPGRWATHSLPLPVTLIFVFPLVVWAAVRFVPSVAVTVGTVLGLFAFDAVLAGAGPFRGGATGDHMFYLNVFMGVCIGTALFLAAAMAQQRRFEAEQARLIGELKAAGAHLRRLEEFVTFCAWTGRVRWKDQWVSVETFLHERYNLSISHGISEEALAGFLRDLPPGATPDLTKPPFSHGSQSPFGDTPPPASPR